MRNSIQKIVGITRDPKKYRDYREENKRSIEVKTRAYKTNTKKPRYSI